MAEPTTPSRRWSDGPGRWAAVVAIVALAALSAVAIAQAKVISFSGKGEDDPQVRVRFDAKVQFDKQHRVEAAWIEDFFADNVEFTCEATGFSGRGDYTFPNNRVKVESDGEFRDTYRAHGRRPCGRPLHAQGPDGQPVRRGQGSRLVQGRAQRRRLGVRRLRHGSNRLQGLRAHRITARRSGSRDPRRSRTATPGAQCLASESLIRADYGSKGGASPQPQRGTGACSTTSAPGWELCIASRVPHST